MLKSQTAFLTLFFKSNPIFKMDSMMKMVVVVVIRERIKNPLFHCLCSDPISKSQQQVFSKPKQSIIWVGPDNLWKVLSEPVERWSLAGLQWKLSIGRKRERFISFPFTFLCRNLTRPGVQNQRQRRPDVGDFFLWTHLEGNVKYFDDAVYYLKSIKSLGWSFFFPFPPIPLKKR